MGVDRKYALHEFPELNKSAYIYCTTKCKKDKPFFYTFGFKMLQIGKTIAEIPEIASTKFMTAVTAAF